MPTYAVCQLPYLSSPPPSLPSVPWHLLSRIHSLANLHCPETFHVYCIPMTSYPFVLHFLLLLSSLYPYFNFPLALYTCSFYSFSASSQFYLTPPSPLDPFTAYFWAHKHLISVSWFLPFFIQCSCLISVHSSTVFEQKKPTIDILDKMKLKKMKRISTPVQQKAMCLPEFKSPF